MKASVTKITEEARLRDTIRRNIINVIDSRDMGNVLYTYQMVVSQVAGTKQHTIILIDDDGSAYTLFFNVAKIEGFDLRAYIANGNKEKQEEDENTEEKGGRS